MAGYTRQAAANIVTGGVIDAADFNAEYNAIEAAFNGSTGHTHDGTAGNGPNIENLGPANDLVVTSSVVRPKTTNTYDFGTSVIQWKDGFFDGTLTTDVLLVDETSTFTGNVTTVADVAIGGNLTVTGNATINGNLTFGDSAADSVSFGADILTNLIPDGTTQDLGSLAKQWRNLYIDGQAQIDDLVADTADINGGTIDGTTIGANNASTIIGTTVQATTGFTGDVTGNVTGDLTGNADTATALETARTIAGQSFDGTANITIAPTDLTGVTATAAEINKLDGFTGVVADLNYAKDLRATGVTATEFNKLDGLAATTTELNLLSGLTASTTELNKLDGVTASTSELNLLDGVTATTAELNYLDGVTSNIQTQLGAKQATITGAATTIDDANLTANRALVSNGSGKVAVSAVTSTELGYLDGVTSNIQTQINNAGTTYSAGSGLDLSGTTFSVETDLRDGITHVGRDSNDYIAIGTTTIDFVLDGATDMRLENDGDLHVEGDVVGFSTTISDKRLKYDIEKIDGALDKVSQLSGYTFSYNKNGKRSAGVIAQEVEKVLPSAVENKSLAIHTGEEGVEYKTVKYDQLHGLLIEAIKELKAEIEELKNASA